MDEEDYGDIADEDLIEVLSQASQTLPTLPRPTKRRRTSEEPDSEEVSNRCQRNSRASNKSGGSGGEEDGREKGKKKKYRIHVAEEDIPAPKFVGATQAEALPDSSPYRIRGPIWAKPRPLPPKLPMNPPAFSTTSRQSVLPFNPVHGQENIRPQVEVDYGHEFEDLPSDAFSPPEKVLAQGEPTSSNLSPLRGTLGSSFTSRQRLATPQNGLRQTTLFGGHATQEVSSSQANKLYNYIVDKPPEAPTHHALNAEALKTWVYPTNLGAIRDYQYSIVKHGLFHNLLVALPTGLGKTFIAATIMYNYFRWTKNAQIVFVAPTKPLVAQQVDACFNIVGIPKSQTTMLTGEQAPALRAEEWGEKRVFFMTPQTLENDLSSGIADPKKIVLLVVDEAHRATGNYAYVKVVNFLRRFNNSFRILALTATPGASVEAVQEVIDGLEISKVEIRTEESIDIQQYVHRRDINQILLEPSDEIIMIKELFSKALQPLMSLLCGQNAYWNKDPMSITPYGMMQARKRWFQSDTGRRAHAGVKGMMNGLFSILASVAHSIKLLNFHGVGPFFSNIKDFQQEVEDSKKPGKFRKQIIDSPDFKKMMDRIALWVSKDDFVGHPKITFLCDTILNHFLDAGEGRLGKDAPPSATRVIVFSEFRDSAEDIARVLNRHEPMIRASVFVGQADSKRSEGMNQAKQQETIAKFKSGKFNVIIATSIGEEGLDIGQVDLIVCYDASASPIRMLQRMGRTGRKRAGNIVLLLMRGKEEESFIKAKDNYEQMQKMVSSGQRFTFRHDLSVRIIPRDITPVVDKRNIEIPIENTQDPSLPEPKRRALKAKKKPPKKFHMPDGVETGFRNASKLSEGADLAAFGITRKSTVKSKSQLLPIPDPASVLLSPAEEKELERRFQYVAGDDVMEVSMPNVTGQTFYQRSLAPVCKVEHGLYTKRCVKLFKTLADSQRDEDRHLWPYGEEEPSLDYLQGLLPVEDETLAMPSPTRHKKPAPAKRKQTPKVALVVSDIENDELPAKPKNSKKAASIKARRAPRTKAKAKAKATLVMSDIEDDGTESDQLPTRHKKGVRRAASVSGDDTEGEGDELLSEELSVDDEGDLESLKDFIAPTSEVNMEEEDSSDSFVTPLTAEQELDPSLGSSLHTASQDTPDVDADDDMSDIPASVKSNRLASEIFLDDDSDVQENTDKDEDEEPIVKRKKRRRVVEDSDSDE